VVDRVRRLINQQWPEARLELFGSFRTGLYLPLSDIDLVLFGDWESPPLRRLARLLRESGSCGDIKVLDRASVPIVKATDAVTGLSVDISFNMPNSVRAAGLIQDFVQQFPCLPHLVLVLKQFLLQRNLNERHGSDLSRPVAELDLGQLLVEFFELYGCRFDYMSTGIRLKDGGAHLPKEQLLRDMEPGLRPSVLCIEDPLTPGNDIGRSSYGALQALTMRSSSSIAASVLTTPLLRPVRHRCSRPSSRPTGPSAARCCSAAGAAAAAYSPLSRIIRVSEDVLRFRGLGAARLRPAFAAASSRPASAATAESPNLAAEQPPELLPVSPQPPPPPPRPSYASVAKRPPPPQRRGSGGSSSSVGSAEVIGGGSSEAAQSATTGLAAPPATSGPPPPRTPTACRRAGSTQHPPASKSRRVDGGGTGGSGSSSGGLRQVGQWKPEDDQLLVQAVLALHDLRAVHCCVRFSCAFAESELRERWRGLLFDRTLSGLAEQAARALPPPSDSCCAVGRRSPTLRRTCWPRRCLRAASRWLALSACWPPGLTSSATAAELPRRCTGTGSCCAAPRPPPRLPSAGLAGWRSGHRLQGRRISGRAIPLGRPGPARPAAELDWEARKARRRLCRLEEEARRWQVAAREALPPAARPPEPGDQFVSSDGRPGLALLKGTRASFLISGVCVSLGRRTDACAVDIDLGLEGPSGKISRLHAFLRLLESGAFQLENVGAARCSSTASPSAPARPACCPPPPCCWSAAWPSASSSTPSCTLAASAAPSPRRCGPGGNAVCLPPAGAEIFM
uniref:polynucleotide adenylyltransferase n=1 Tax=Macrostomum lignano TaxID=282301 RepID=A0A1I8F4D9_9PLAT